MKTLTKILALSSMAAGALLLSTTANAALFYCPENTNPTYMTIDTGGAGGSATCAFSGDGNDATEPFFDDFDLLWKIDFDDGPSGPGPNPFVDFGGDLGTSGTFILVEGLNDHLLVFKFGGGQTNPNLFAFAIDGITSGSWSITDPEPTNGLSHVAIYGAPVDVPEPATLALLGLGLVGFGLSRRRKTV